MSNYVLNTQTRALLESTPTDPGLGGRVKGIKVRLDEDQAGDTLLYFTVFVDLTGIKAMSAEASNLLNAVHSIIKQRLDPAGAYDVRPHIHFQSAAA